MTDVPYTTPEEDPFNRLPCVLQPRRRSSSLLDRWIQEQRKSSDDDSPPQSPQIKYPANPEPTNHCHLSQDDIVTLDNYDLVNDDDIPKSLPHVATTPTKRSPKILPSPNSLRNFKPFRSISPAASPLLDTTQYRPRFSLLQRTSRHTPENDSRKSIHQHSRSTSLSALNLTGRDTPTGDNVNVSTPKKWRPSVLGHFSSPSNSRTCVPSDTDYTPSRPSISSADTATSSAATTECDLPLTPSRLNLFDSIRFRTRPNRSFSASTSGTRSTDFLQSEKLGQSLGPSSTLALQTVFSHTESTTSGLSHHQTHATRPPFTPKPGSRLAYLDCDLSDDGDDDQTYHAIVPAKKQPDLTRPQVAYSSGKPLSRVTLSSLNPRQRKKKRLVISGVGPKDVRKFEGVKRWCESFGEVSQIVRMPNGDLHVHFRLAEVADTVCRVRAKVYIAKVGSVQLSWLTGDQR